MKRPGRPKKHPDLKLDYRPPKQMHTLGKAVKDYCKRNHMSEYNFWRESAIEKIRSEDLQNEIKDEQQKAEEKMNLLTQGSNTVK